MSTTISLSEHSQWLDQAIIALLKLKKPFKMVNMITYLFAYNSICSFLYFFSVPDGNPQNVIAATISSTSISVLWEMVPLISQNGIIITYEVLLEPGVMVNSSDLNVTIEDLNENTIYNISVRAFTIIGSGPSSSPIVTVRTLEDRKQ